MQGSHKGSGIRLQDTGAKRSQREGGLTALAGEERAADGTEEGLHCTAAPCPPGPFLPPPPSQHTCTLRSSSARAKRSVSLTPMYCFRLGSALRRL